MATIHSLSHKKKCNKNVSGEIQTYVTSKRNPENMIQGKIHELQRTSIMNQSKQMRRPRTGNNSTRGGSWDGGRHGMKGHQISKCGWIYIQNNEKVRETRWDWTYNELFVLNCWGHKGPCNHRSIKKPGMLSSEGLLLKRGDKTPIFSCPEDWE